MKEWQPREIYRASEVFCTGTMGELVSVAEVDGRKIVSIQIDSLTEKLRDLYMEYTKTHGEAIEL